MSFSGAMCAKGMLKHNHINPQQGWSCLIPLLAVRDLIKTTPIFLWGELQIIYHMVG